MRLYHASFVPVREFEPRVPKCKTKGEDNVTKRICMSPSIVQCLAAIPQGIDAILGLKELGITPVLYLYEFYFGQHTPGLIYPADLTDKVPDVRFTREHWLLEKKQPRAYKKIKILKLDYLNTRDIHGNKIYPIKELKWQETDMPDSLLQFKSMLADYPQQNKMDMLLNKYSFTTIMATVFRKVQGE